MKNILLALDLKGSDKELIEHAKKYASKFSSKVWILHVAAPEPDFVGYDVGPQYIRETRAETLKGEHKKLHAIMKNFEADGLTSDALLIAGPTIETLEKEVEKLQIDLLILGNRRHGFIYNTLIGSTTNELTKALQIPILLIPISQ